MGIESQILCVDRKLPPEESVLVPSSPMIRLGEALLRPVTVRIGLNNVHRLGGFRLPSAPAYQAADLLDIHCLHGDYLSYLALPRISRDKPVVLTLHDMFPITGHCAFSFDCLKWRSGCGGCPYPDEFPAVWRDNTRVEWKLKRWTYRRSALAAVAPSRWLADAAKQSPLAETPVYHIPYGVDTDVYAPRSDARDVLALPRDRRVILAAAAAIGAGQRDRKGGDLLIAALRALPESLRAKCVLVVMGRADPEFLRQVPVEVRPLGYVRDDVKKAEIYAAADSVVCSTRADNLPLVVLESLACGTPVVAFAVGGVPEAVREGETGALADAEDSGALARAMTRILELPNLSSLRAQCRRVALAEYDLRLQASRTASMYDDVLHAFAERRGRAGPSTGTHGLSPHRNERRDNGSDNHG